MSFAEIANARREAGLGFHTLLRHPQNACDSFSVYSHCSRQVFLAEHLTGLDRQRLRPDMDARGYSFRLGSAHTWFERDAEDAGEWLRRLGLVDTQERPTGRGRAQQALTIMGKKTMAGLVSHSTRCP